LLKFILPFTNNLSIHLPNLSIYLSAIIDSLLFYLPNLSIYLSAIIDNLLFYLPNLSIYLSTIIDNLLFYLAKFIHLFIWFTWAEYWRKVLRRFEPFPEKF